MDDDVLDSFLLPNTPSGKRCTRLLADGRVVVFESVLNLLGVGNTLMLNGGKALDGRYTLKDGVTRFEVLGGVVVHEYYIEGYPHKGRIILVDCSRMNGFGSGCAIYTKEGPLSDGVYRLKRFKWVKVENGLIVQTSIFRIKQ
ncbi:hypothetical protein FUA23_00055 [Neolewinella aurantiaca]|uniref:Uncharacterized protein n=1 Tax=Neolewinella aurantiaca TaxID=2602767 RepID=A0A5C7G193_9BACT|nr:hypothetical protein [Neolewinella aurantiaca]TXF91612.1 hypothetical protein FUA23_00055 [Neolewinella aurantiaca]